MKRLLGYFKGLTTDVILGPVLKLAEAGLDLLIPIVILRIINNGVANGDTAYTVKMMLVLICIGTVGFAIAIIAQYFCARAACVFAGRIRKALLEKITVMSAKDAETTGDSTLVTRLTSDVEQVQNGVNLTLRLLLRAPVIVVGATVLSFTVNVRLALVFCVLVPLISAIVISVLVFSTPKHAATRKALDSIVVTARENISGVRVVRAFNTEKKRVISFSESSDKLAVLQTAAGNVSSLLNPLTAVSVNAALVAIVIIGNSYSAKGLATAGEIIALCNYMTQMLTELLKFANLVINVTKAGVCADRIAGVIYDTESQVRENCNDKSDHLIEFRNVTFSYGGEPALSDVSFFVEGSEHIGIIGGTGSGKTTIASLICRIYDVSDGAVFVRGSNVLSYDPEELRNSLSVVPQKTSLFSGTVASNVSFGDENPDENRIADSINRAMAGDFVFSSGKRSDEYEITQNGKNLSGGQRQRISVARALYRKSDVLILDDYNSALDYSTDLSLRKSIFSLPWSPAVIVISQRISAVKSCDRILVLDDGRIVGNGSHDELIENCPVYRELYKSQTEGGYDDRQ